jgi:hypothetical protein
MARSRWHAERSRRGASLFRRRLISRAYQTASSRSHSLRSRWTSPNRRAMVLRWRSFVEARRGITRRSVGVRDHTEATSRRTRAGWDASAPLLHCRRGHHRRCLCDHQPCGGHMDHRRVRRPRPSGARLGAMLQALIAREPAERRPIINGWLPPGFIPPQITILSAQSFIACMCRRWHVSGHKVARENEDLF